MACRLISANYGRSTLTKSIFKVALYQKVLMRSKSSSATKPSVPFFDKPSLVFSTQALNHHWGAWPVVIVLVVGFACEVLGMMYLGATRSDVWYTNAPAPCETIETRKGYQPPICKIMVINQKREYPPGLLEAWQGDVDGPPFEDDKKKKKK